MRRGERNWALKTDITVKNIYLVNAINFSLVFSKEKFEIQTDMNFGTEIYLGLT